MLFFLFIIIIVTVVTPLLSLVQFGSILQRVSTVWSQKLLPESSQVLLDFLCEYELFVESAQSTFDLRLVTMRACQQAQIDMEAKEAEYNNYVNSKNAKADVSSRLRGEKEAKQEGFSKMLREFQAMSSQFLVEYDLFKTQMESDMLEMLRNYLSIKLEFHKECLLEIKK